MSDYFGALVTRGDVEWAAISTLQTPHVPHSPPRIVYYLAEVERNRGLKPRTLPVPPSGQSFRGGIDFDTFEEPWLPLITVVCQPTGQAERYAAGEYGQWYELQIGATVGARDEDTARALADAYGAAIMGCIAKHGSLGNFSEKTVLIESSRTEFVNPDVRRFIRSVTTFHTYVQLVVTEQGGPPATFTDPYAAPGDFPAVQTVDVELTAIAAGAPLP